MKPKQYETGRESVPLVLTDDPTQIDPIVEEVRADFLRRSQIGIKKYNTTLARTDLTLLQWHQHQYEELLDAAAYTKKIIKELEKNEPNRSI